MNILDKKTQQFRDSIAALPREDILDILRVQDPEIIRGINRIEWVFEKKLRHLNWSDGTQITGRPMTNEELALLVDEPFELDDELSSMGVNVEQQRQLHIA